jgi:hypothetical protein
MAKNTICLWYDRDAEAAARFYDRVMSHCFLAISLALLATACAADPPIDRLPPGSVDEMVTQQMRLQLKPPVRAPDDGVVVDVPPTEEGENLAPLAVKNIRVTGRTSSSISLRWHDRSDIEDGTRVRRRESTGGWQDIATFGPLSGFNEMTDGGLSPDQLYCYQFVGFNEHDENFSPQRCAYTRGDEVRPIFRAQLMLQTGDVPDAGTDDQDDQVTVRLNSPPSIFTPSGNVTVINYGRDDFERGDRFTYDLELNDLSNLEDVTLVSLSKTGNDGWCVEFIELWINNRRVFADRLGSTDEPCVWLDTGDSRMHTIFHEALRGHADWQRFVNTFPFEFDREEIESRIEGMVGNLIAANDLVQWDPMWPPSAENSWVEATRKNNKTVHIDLDLEGDVPAWFNPAVDVDFDVIFEFTLRGGQWEVDIATANLEADVDFDWFTETVSFILPCGPAISVATGEGIPDCISALEEYITDKIRRGWEPIAKHFVVGTPCLDGFHPEAIVNELEGELESVSLGCIEDPR